MLRLRSLVAALALSCVAFIQAVAGSLSGIVSDSHSVLPNAPVQARNKATGAISRTVSNKEGHYTFAALPAGQYEVSIAMPCCAYDRFRKDVSIDGTGAATLDARLEENITGTTLGDDPARTAQMMLARAHIPVRPVPKLGAHPDLSGVWLNLGDPYPESAEMLPAAAAIAAERGRNLGKDHPHNRCLPGAPPIPGASVPFIGKIVQTRNLVVLLFEDVPGFRQIFLDGRGHLAEFNPSWMGHSVGHWEGDTLVVDTVGFNDQIWLAGAVPTSEKLHLTERYRRIDYSHLELKATFEDPGTLAKAFHINSTWSLAPQEELIEFVCENNKPEHLVGR